MKIFEDQEAKAKNFIYKKLLEDQDVLPSASAVELAYALNPQLKQMKVIPANYKLIRAKTPPVTEQLMQSFKLAFKEDQQLDPTFQRALRDTINKCVQLFTSYQNIAPRNSETWHTASAALNHCYSDMRSTNVAWVNKALCIQLMNLISGCISVLEGVIEKKAISEKDEESIIDLCYDLSFIFLADRLRMFFKENPIRKPVALFVAPELQTPEEGTGGNEYTLSGPAASADNYFQAARPSVELRSFRVSVQLRKGNTIVTDGPDITGRYKVTFYPPALKDYKTLHIGCHGLATYSSISLAATIYGTKVYDLKENRECNIIGSAFIDARNISQKPGGKNYEIQIFVDDKAHLVLEEKMFLKD
jgi:hypothetical protein